MRRHAGAALLLAGLLVGCGAHDSGEPAARPVKVRVAVAVTHDFAVRLRAAGRIAPPVDRQASVSAPVSGGKPRLVVVLRYWVGHGMRSAPRRPACTTPGCA